jgi:hypothetical protein
MSGFVGGRSVIPARPRPGIDGDSPFRNALRSIPAQNVPPAPVSTAAAASSRDSNSSIAALIASAVSLSIAFFASGRLMVITMTRSRTSVRTESVIIIALRRPSIPNVV